MASGIPLRKSRRVMRVERLTIPGHYTSSTPSLTLRTGQAEIAFCAEHIGVKARDPLPSAGSDVEIADRGLNVRRDTFPIKLRIEVRDIGWRRVAQLTVEPDFLELLVQRVGLAEIVWIAQLPDQIGGAQQQALFARRIFRLVR